MRRTPRALSGASPPTLCRSTRDSSQTTTTAAMAHAGEPAGALRKAGFDARYMAGGHYAWKAIKGPAKLME
jgi:hypothetical protein